MLIYAKGGFDLAKEDISDVNINVQCTYLVT